MNYLDLFSGCGGFRLGLQKAGVTPEYEFHSEIDKHADKVYAENYPQSENLGDVTKITTTDGTINGTNIDLVTFGFPCQDLSIAGKGEGLGGSRSGLFYEATRLIREIKPEVFIFENVKGLLTNNRGNDFTAVLREIADIGIYECQWQLCNTRWLLPQNRERIFFIGCLAGSSRSGRQVFPITEDDGFYNATKGEEIQQGGEAWTLTARQYASWRGNHVLETLPRGNNKGSISDICPTITSNSFEHNVRLHLKNRACAVPVLTPDREKKRQNGRRFKEDGDPSFTLTAQDKHGVYDGHNIRRLTPIECERLQGFHDGWTSSASDTQRYKMLGNAVTADMAMVIFNKLYN